MQSTQKFAKTGNNMGLICIEGEILKNGNIKIYIN